MLNYKLIALDVDGTLLDDHHHLSDQTIRTVRQVHEQGATIVLCTGRGPGNAIPIMEALGLEGTVITHNGAATVTTSDRSIVHQYPFELDELAYFIHYCREHRIHYDVSSPLHLHVDYELQDAVKQLYTTFKISPVYLENLSTLPERPVKFTAYSPNKEQLDRVQADWMNANSSSSLLVLRSGDQFIDVMHAEASKGNALRELAKSLGIDRSQVLAMGNYYNDVDMIQFAGWGIAMDNSPDDVKRLADEVTVSNNEGGVYRSLLKHCLNA